MDKFELLSYIVHIWTNLNTDSYINQLKVEVPSINGKHNYYYTLQFALDPPFAKTNTLQGSLTEKYLQRDTTLSEFESCVFDSFP